MIAIPAAIADIYQQVSAPDWASPNLDGLADALRDLSWRPAGPVTVRVPSGLDRDDRRRLREVLERAVAQTADGDRPVQLVGAQSP